MAVRAMNIVEKILCHHAQGLQTAEVKPGDVICVKCDWVMANELTLVGITDMWKKFGKPPVANKERVWLAVDHTVDPRIYTEPKPTALMKLSEDFAAETGITDYWKPNTTIMHTEFARQRAQPGQIVVGADSHTCSAGGMGAFACGLGAADVAVPLVTGHTWFKVPETVLIEFVGAPRFGVGGKDVILHVLGELKRNTVALDRAVEFSGPGLAHMSADARFAIANMTTEFGGIVGVFEADEVTARTLQGRKAHKDEGLYFRADPAAEYAARYTIDLAAVVPQVALFPSPDNCQPVPQLQGMALDGVFIGACTTTQEDLILGALILEAMMREGAQPKALANANNRRVTPGSLAIIDHLKKHGLIDIYERAGFVVGVPGCSYCLGIAADVAGDGEVWLSSQNRNFKNRMGKGSIANLASAAVVAASSFSMTVTDPTPVLARVDQARYDQLREWIPSAATCHSGATAAELPPPTFAVSEPSPQLASAQPDEAPGAPSADAAGLTDPSVWAHLPSTIKGRVQRFGDGVDTDAIIPAQFMGCAPQDMLRYGGRLDMSEDEFLGAKCFGYVRPEFSGRVAGGANIVVAEEGFGCGSSREEAVRSLVNSGVKAVFAKSFAFIYARNQPNFSLLGGIVKDEAFYQAAQEGAELSVDVGARTVSVHAPDGAVAATYPFVLSTMEERFLKAGGVERLYRQFRRELFKALLKGPQGAAAGGDEPRLPELAQAGAGCGGGDDCGSGVSAAVGAAPGALQW